MLFALPSQAAPSFDCAAAALPIERALCGNAELGDLEGEMTRLFEQRLADASKTRADRLRRNMRGWLGRLTKDCGVPTEGEFSAADIERVSPCLARKYRDQITALQPPAETPAAAAAADSTPPTAAPQQPTLEPSAGPELAAVPAPAAPADEDAGDYAWRAEAYGEGVVAIIARLGGEGGYATASVYCDSEYPERVPVFLYRLGQATPDAAEVERLNGLLEGATLAVDGRTVQQVGREDLGQRFSGLQLLPDGTLAYMLLIDPTGLEPILAGQQLRAVLQLPEGEGGPYAAETFPLRNSRNAIESAMQDCVTLDGASPPA
jgi:hypothetical protein